MRACGRGALYDGEYILEIPRDGTGCGVAIDFPGVINYPGDVSAHARDKKKTMCSQTQSIYGINTRTTRT